MMKVAQPGFLAREQVRQPGAPEVDRAADGLFHPVVVVVAERGAAQCLQLEGCHEGVVVGTTTPHILFGR
jgi:hypothetical protein